METRILLIDVVNQTACLQLRSCFPTRLAADPWVALEHRLQDMQSDATPVAVSVKKPGRVIHRIEELEQHQIPKLLRGRLCRSIPPLTGGDTT